MMQWDLPSPTSAVGMASAVIPLLERSWWLCQSEPLAETGFKRGLGPVLFIWLLLMAKVASVKALLPAASTSIGMEARLWDVGAGGAHVVFQHAEHTTWFRITLGSISPLQRETWLCTPFLHLPGLSKMVWTIALGRHWLS